MDERKKERKNETIQWPQKKFFDIIYNHFPCFHPVHMQISIWFDMELIHNTQFIYKYANIVLKRQNDEEEEVVIRKSEIPPFGISSPLLLSRNFTINGMKTLNRIKCQTSLLINRRYMDQVKISLIARDHQRTRIAYLHSKWGNHTIFWWRFEMTVASYDLWTIVQWSKIQNPNQNI